MLTCVLLDLHDAVYRRSPELLQCTRFSSKRNVISLSTSTNDDVNTQQTMTSSHNNDAISRTRQQTMTSRRRLADDCKLFKKRFRLDVRKFSFSKQVVDNGNCLSASCVNSGTIDNLTPSRSKYRSNWNQKLRTRYCISIKIVEICLCLLMSDINGIGEVLVHCTDGQTDGSPHPVHITSLQSLPLLSSSVTPSTFHSRLKTHLFHKCFPP